MNDPGDVAIGEAQLFVEVTDEGMGQVRFTFMNSGPHRASITAVYFDNGDPAMTLMGIDTLIDSDDGMGGDPFVDFSLGASPKNLPGANLAMPPFEVTPMFLADSDAGQGGRVAHGVMAHQELGVVFNLLPGFVFDDVITALADGTLRIGIKVQAFESNGSESFINDPMPECIGDANQDGVVDVLDIQYVIDHFGCAVGAGDPGCDSADQNHDGVVNPLDKGFVENHLGPCE